MIASFVDNQQSEQRERKFAPGPFGYGYDARPKSFQNRDTVSIKGKGLRVPREPKNRQPTEQTFHPARHMLQKRAREVTVRPVKLRLSLSQTQSVSAGRSCCELSDFNMSSIIYIYIYIYW